MLLKIKWYKWQREFLAHKGNCTLRCGRQSGKTEATSEKGARFALDNPGVTVMIIAASQRQSSLLFEKVVARLSEEKDVFLEKPTMTKALLKNG